MNTEAILRKTAAEIRAQGINGRGNACEAGADRIRDLEATLRNLIENCWGAESQDDDRESVAAARRVLAVSETEGESK